MHIVQILPELNQGGVERGTTELSRELVKLGHRSTVISAGGGLATQIEKDGGQHVQVDVCSKNPITFFQRAHILSSTLQTLRPTLIHARSRLPAWLCHFANKKLKLPFVTTVHGLNSVSRYSRIMSTGDRVICVSEVVRDYIIRNYQTDPGKIRVIQRGVDMNVFNPESVCPDKIQALKNQFNLNNRVVVTSVGRITWLKDYETFIRAIAAVRKQAPEVIGLIVGGYREDKAEYYESLKKLAEKEVIKDHLIFAGNQSDMATVYAASDIVVNASLKMGNMGRTVVEALALGKPVIATTFEGLNNLVIDGKNGFIVKTKDAGDLSNALQKTINASFDAQTIRASVPDAYTLNTMVQQVLDIYAELSSPYVHRIWLDPVS